ncbi:FliH/SctL family protein [Pseudomonas sp. Marseille-QA0892]
MTQALPNRPAGPIIRSEHVDCWTDGFAFLEEAHREASRIREEAEQEAEARFAQAHAEGLQVGRYAAAELLARARARLDSYVSGLEGQMAELAVTLVRQLVLEQPKPDVIAGLAARALQGYRDKQGLSLHVPPEWAEPVQARLEAALPMADVPRIVSDPQLEGVQATLVGPFAVVDLDLESQLDQLLGTLRTAESKAA